MADIPLKTEVLQFLLELCDSRSLPVAASRLGISPATAFRLLKQARLEFSDPLFVKSGRTMIFTPRMKELEPKIKSIMDNLSQLKRPNVFDPSSSQRTIRIGCIDNGVLGFIVPVIDKIYRESPQLRISIEPITEHFQLRLSNGRLDLAFYAPPSFKPTEGIMSYKLFEAGHVYVVRKGHPLLSKLKEKGRLTKKDLKTYRMIALKYGITEEAITKMSAGIAPEDQIAIDMPYFLPSAFVLMKTDFIVRYPIFTARILSEILPVELLPSYLLNEKKWTPIMLWHRRTQNDPLLQWLRALFIESFHK